ncbi:MAG: C39 family peptidase [Deltaproteobacteria bacterium]|nr:C39 family peptidase [Deltaproteobacteria bacterium]
MERKLELEILAQPDDSSCGPTCLHAVYRYYGETIPLQQVIRETGMLETGGTLAVKLGIHALRRGYSARLHSYNLAVFDPSWFQTDTDLAEKLRAQASVKSDPRLQYATEAYLEFLALGGKIDMGELNTQLLRDHLIAGRPILTGLSATYLYECPREVGETVLHYDDINGQPTGHFVVLCGYDPDSGTILVADPFHDNPGYGEHYYEEGAERVLTAICLGVLTYDANLLILDRFRKEEADP